jgi:hypothetical protein
MKNEKVKMQNSGRRCAHTIKARVARGNAYKVAPSAALPAASSSIFHFSFFILPFSFSLFSRPTP